MATIIHPDTVSTFSELREDQHQYAGGKGRVLSRLYQNGYFVPDGFIVLSTAFIDDDITTEAWRGVQRLLQRLRRGHPDASFAVRSSAVGEDSVLTSFAGQFDTVLNAGSDDEIRAAIYKVRSSRRSERVRAYGERQGILTIQDIAVIVQRLVRADLSGVLFTADPLTGERNRMVGNYVHGFGDKLVSGDVEPLRFTMERPKRTYGGPPELAPFGRRLYRVSSRLEKYLGGPQDIEWAIAGGKLYILQSRPITTLAGWNPVTGEWNDTHTGDYVWSSVNIGEAMSVVMTPLTASVMRMAFDDMNVVPGHAAVGNIGGRLYQNSTVMITLMQAIRQDVRDISSELGGVRSEYMINMGRYLVPLRRVGKAPMFLNAARMVMKQRRSLKELQRFVRSSPAWCDAARQRILAIRDSSELHAFFWREFWPRSLDSFWMTVASAWKYARLVATLRQELAKMVGEEDADILLSNVSSDDGLLPSLGPVVGLGRVAADQMEATEYLQQWGHRGPLEGELSEPRPAEIPEWLDRQVADYRRSGIDVQAMLADKKNKSTAAWRRFSGRYPGLETRMRRRLRRAADAACAREAARSEAMRAFWVARTWALRAGELTGLGDDVFYLSIQELLNHLSGRDAPTAYIQARRRTHEKYMALPPYPLVIRGRFEPVQWAADPDRDSRFFDSHGLLSQLYGHHSHGDVILGVPGAAGRIDGTVKRLDDPEDAGRLRPDDILVTSQTNIGWTLLFPMVAAVVTDVGAPLSHAAIVARELGIPAVVNCGDATARLHTGDRVRVDGTHGTVELLGRV